MVDSRYNDSSLAVSAHQQQNLEIPSERWPDAKPIDTRFPGHDDYQNGVIANGKECTFYVQATDKQIEDALNKNAHFSGFATDAKECEKAIDPNTGKLDANVLSERLQTAPWSADTNASGTYRSNVAAFEVNWDALNDPQNVDLKEKLCNSDGLSTGSEDIKVAYGQTRANTHWGEGGGTQYYIDGDTFNEAINRGVLQYREDKSFRECNGTLQRSALSPNEMKQMEEDRKENVREFLKNCSDKGASTDVEKAKFLNEMTPEKVKEVNSAIAPEGDYLAKPDPVYQYGQAENTAPKADRISSDNISAVTGGGIHAPPIASNDKCRFSDERSLRDKFDNAKEKEGSLFLENENECLSARKGELATENSKDSSMLQGVSSGQLAEEGFLNESKGRMQDISKNGDEMTSKVSAIKGSSPNTDSWMGM